MGLNDHLDKRNKTPKPKNAKPSTASYGEWRGFINVHLTDAVKKQWFQWAADTTTFYGELEQMCRDGYKITLKWEERNDAFSAFATPKDSDHDNAGWGLSERAGDPFTALHRLVYIHSVVLSRDWDGYKSQTTYTDNW